MNTLQIYKPEKIIIRSVTNSDAGDISEIYKYYVEQTTISFEKTAPDASEMHTRIEQLTGAGFPYIVAECDGEILGYAYAHLWKERAAYNRTWETTVYVAEGCKSWGIGQMLMNTLIEKSQALGCHSLIACITAENTASRRFHEHLGFNLVSEFHEVGYKYGRYLDVTDYELLLNKS